jgi:hypothetical protein
VYITAQAVCELSLSRLTVATMSGSRPPPRGPVPLSNEEMAIIKKKVAPPKGPPPAGFANFKAPKKYGEEENHSDTHHRPPSQRRQHGGEMSDEDENNFRDRRHLKQRYQNDEDEVGGHHRQSRSEEKHHVHYPHQNDEIEDLDTEDNHWHPPIKRNSTETTKRSSNRETEPDDDEQQDRDFYRNKNRSISTPYDDSKQTHTTTMSNNQHHSNTNATNTNRLKIYNYKKILKSSFKELKSFVTSPCEVNTVIRCYIERNRSGTNYLTPVYSLCADLEDGTGRELISCRKFLKSKTSYYIFSLKAEDLYRKREQRGRYYLGKLRAVSTDDYVLYDNGVCDTMRSNGTSTDLGDDEDDDEDDGQGGGRGRMSLSSAAAQRGSYDTDESSLFRSQLTIVHYNTKVRPVDEGVRGMEVCLPRLSQQHESTSGLEPTSQQKHADMMGSFDKIMKSGRQNELFANKFLILHEKRSRSEERERQRQRERDTHTHTPSMYLTLLYRYDPLSSCLVDFQGRATVASVKNFQLLYSTPSNDSSSRNAMTWSTEGRDEEIILQMGKVGRGIVFSSPLIHREQITGECFNMDFKYPLNMLQAFAISVSRSSNPSIPCHLSPFTSLSLSLSLLIDLMLI